MSTTLSPAEAAQLIAQLHADGALDGTLVVGGQAIQYWAGYFHIRPRLPSITRDVDLFGTRQQAQRAAAQLALPHTLYVAGMDRATPNSAQLEVQLVGHAQPVLVDFLVSVAGLNSPAMLRRAATVEIGGVQVRVLHPLDCLASKLFNLKHFQDKRTPEGVEQGRLAIEIAKAFVKQLILFLIETAPPGKHGSTGNVGERTQQRASRRKSLLKAIEMIHDIAVAPGALFAYLEYGLDCMLAIPKRELRAAARNSTARVEPLVPGELLTVRLPQMEAHVKAKRDALSRRRSAQARAVQRQS